MQRLLVSLDGAELNALNIIPKKLRRGCAAHKPKMNRLP